MYNNLEFCIRSRMLLYYATVCSTDNAYPFLSGASRQILSIPKDSHKFPGPDCYNIEVPRKHISERAFSLLMPHLFAIFLLDNNMYFTCIL